MQVDDKVKQSDISEDKFNSEDIVDQSYRAVIDPAQFDSLEECWEAFLDDAFQTADENIKTQRRMHNIEQAHAVLQRLGRQSSIAVSAQDIADHSSGIGFVIDGAERIIARNSAAQELLGNVSRLSEEALTNLGFATLSNWIGSGGLKPDSKYSFHNIIDAAGHRKVFLASKISLSHEDEQSHFFVTELDLLLNEDILEEIDEAFGLTRAESEVCLLLSNGLQPTEIAAKRKVSIHTIRTQIKSAIDKTGAKNVTDLVRSLCGLASRFNFLQAKLNSGQFRKLTDNFTQSPIRK